VLAILASRSLKEGTVRSPRLILALVLVAGLAACHRGGHASDATGASNKQLIDSGDADVAKVCASDETLDGLKAMVLSSVDAAKTVPAINPADRTELGTGGHVVLDTPILSSFDKTTRKVTCSAKISFVWPPDVMDRLKAANPAKSWQFQPASGEYTIQPQADDRALVYALDQTFQDKAKSTALSVLKTLARQEIAANAPPAPSGASAAAAAAASDSSVDPDATGDTSVRSATPPTTPTPQ
jgi:hypothetical protein